MLQEGASLVTLMSLLDQLSVAVEDLLAPLPERTQLGELEAMLERVRAHMEHLCIPPTCQSFFFLMLSQMNHDQPDKPWQAVVAQLVVPRGREVMLISTALDLVVLVQHSLSYQEF